jgi:hypothetical protein
MKQEIKKAFESAEQEIQEKEIANLKGIIKSLLEKKVEKEKDKREIEKEISVIKTTIDDFKAGRLDKIKELQEKDSTAERLLPFKIIIINQPVITQPWGWNYQVVPHNYNYNSSWALTSASSVNAINTLAVSSGLTGNTYAAFTSGAYNVPGASGTVNL